MPINIKIKFWELELKSRETFVDMYEAMYLCVDLSKLGYHIAVSDEIENLGDPRPLLICMRLCICV